MAMCTSTIGAIKSPLMTVLSLTVIDHKCGHHGVYPILTVKVLCRTEYVLLSKIKISEYVLPTLKKNKVQVSSILPGDRSLVSMSYSVRVQYNPG